MKTPPPGKPLSNTLTPPGSPLSNTQLNTPVQKPRNRTNIKYHNSKDETVQIGNITYPIKYHTLKPDTYIYRGSTTNIQPSALGTYVRFFGFNSINHPIYQNNSGPRIASNYGRVTEYNPKRNLKLLRMNNIGTRKYVEKLINTYGGNKKELLSKFKFSYGTRNAHNKNSNLPKTNNGKKVISRLSEPEHNIPIVTFLQELRRNKNKSFNFDGYISFAINTSQNSKKRRYFHPEIALFTPGNDLHTGNVIDVNPSAKKPTPRAKNNPGSAGRGQEPLTVTGTTKKLTPRIPRASPYTSGSKTSTPGSKLGTPGSNTSTPRTSQNSRVNNSTPRILRSTPRTKLFQ